MSNPSTPDKPTRYESATQPGLFYWAERNGIDGKSWLVVAQANGFPASEAFDDWLANFADADAIARQLAAGGVV